MKIGYIKNQRTYTVFASLIKMWLPVSYKCFAQAHQVQNQLLKTRVLCNNPNNKERTMGKFMFEFKDRDGLHLWSFDLA